MSDVCLPLLNCLKRGYGAKVNALASLANSTDGPLRIKIKNNVPYLGVRSWPTYFFEKIVCVDSQIKRIEAETEKAILKYIDPFLGAAEARIADANDPALFKFSAESLSFRLQAKAAGKGFNLKVEKTVLLKAFTTKPAYKVPSIKRATATAFNGRIAVPSGLSIGVVPVEKVMTDCRLVENIATSLPLSGEAYNADRHDSLPTRKPSNSGYKDMLDEEKNFFNFYLQNLRTNTNSFRTSVAIQISSDTATGASAQKRNGVWRAAKVFMRERMEAGASVSVLLCVENDLPHPSELNFAMPEHQAYGSHPRASEPHDATLQQKLPGESSGIAISEIKKRSSSSRLKDSGSSDSEDSYDSDSYDSDDHYRAHNDEQSDDSDNES